MKGLTLGLCYLMLFSLISKAQQVYFSKRNNGNILTVPTNNWMEPLCFSVDSSSYIVSGAIKDPFNPNTNRFRIVKYGLNGDLIWEKVYGIDGISMGSLIGCMSTWKDIYISTGGYFKSGNFTHVMLSAFDDNGDTLFMRTLKDSIAQLTPRGLVVEPDNEIAIIGMKIPNLDSIDLILFKLDSNANELWRKTFSSGMVEGSTSIDLAPDGGYLIGGWRYAGPDIQARFFKTDSLGELEWNRWITFQDKVVIRAKYLQNGDILVAGAVEPAFDPWNAYIARYNQDGSQLIWERHFEGETLSTIENFMELDNGDIFLAGVKAIQTNWKQGWLVMLDANGNVRWERHLRDFSHHQYPYSMVQNTDNGFTLAGYGWDTGGMTEGWIARIDSNGCESPVCITPVEQHKPDQPIEVYPNPSRGHLTIRSSQQADALTEIFEISTGRLIKSFNLTDQEQTVNDLPPGSYLLRILTEQNFYYKKVIILQ